MSGRMVLAGVMLKLGAYGLIRLAGALRTPAIIMLASRALAGGAILSVACCQIADIKVIVAYSSVVHMCAITVGVLRGAGAGVEGVV